MNSELVLKWNSENDLEQVAEDLLQWSAAHTIFLFYGTMGIGKTALIKYLCKPLNVYNEVSSPSFSVLQIYGPDANVYHWDLYRLKHESELLDLGWLEYLDRPGYHFVEWSERIEQLVPQRYVKLNMYCINEMHYLHATCIEL